MHNLPKQFEKAILRPTKPEIAVIAMLHQREKRQHDRTTRRVSRQPQKPFQTCGTMLSSLKTIINKRRTKAGVKDIFTRFCISRCFRK